MSTSRILTVRAAAWALLACAGLAGSAPRAVAAPAAARSAAAPHATYPTAPWAEPGPEAPPAYSEEAPPPPADKAAREAWAEIAMLEDTRTTDVSRLVGMLQARPDPLVRWRVCRAFARLQDSTVTGPLLDAVERDSSALVRKEAAFALGQIGSRAPLEGIVFTLRTERDRAVRARMIEALGKLGGKRALGAVAPFLAAPDPMLSREAALACWRINDSTVVLPLVRGTRSADATTRAFSAYALERCPMPDLVVARLDTLLADPDVLVRAYAARALGRQRSPLALVPLYRACADAREEVRISAVRALGVLADSTALPHVLAALHDPSANVRETAATSAAQLKSRDAAAALRTALGDPDGAVRLAAARALATLAPDRAAGDLAPLLRDPERWVRAGAIEALGPVPGDPAMAVLRTAAAPGASVTFEERAAAFSGLAARKTGALAARAEIAAGLRDTSWYVAEAASEAAAATGDSTLTPDLAWLARHDPDPREPDVALGVAAAFEAFGSSAGKVAADSVRAVLATQLASPDRRIREAADKAMRAVFGDSAAALAKAQNPPPAWREGVLAESRAFLASDEPGGALGRVTGARIETAKGTIELALFPREAPHTVANFVALAERGYFDGLAWHRVVPYFVIQDGDPMGTGAGGPGYTIRCEYNPLRYDTGAVGMALSGKDTGGSQYFITLSPQPHLDGRYTIFGHVVKGQNVVAAMRRGDAIRKVTILRR